MDRITKSLIALVALSGVVACGGGPISSGSGGAAGAGGSGGQAQVPTSLTIDTFNVALAGAYIPNEKERREAMGASLAKADTEILCLQEVWRQQDKVLIAEGAKSVFPHSAYFEHNLETKVDDPTDQQGKVPAEPTVPPCADKDINVEFNAVMDCLRDKCSTLPGDDKGLTTSTDCAQQECLGEALKLFASAERKRCYACAVTNLPTVPLGEIRSSCATDAHAGLAFGGQSGVMILSKHPLKDAKAHVLPGTWNRRVILKATATLADSSEVDVYCNHLTPLFGGSVYPYTGSYGDGNSDDLGWAAEQLLQAKKLVGYVKEHSEKRRAVILGDFNASHETKEGDKVVIAAEGEPTLVELETVLTPAIASGYKPLCTFCKDNPITDTKKSRWIDHIFLFGWPEGTVQATSRTFDQPIVSVGDKLVPLSDHYGLRAELKIATEK